MSTSVIAGRSPTLFNNQAFDRRRSRLLWRRLSYAALLALLIHIFFFVVAPYLKMNTAPPQPTEVVQITPEDLARMKKDIAKNKVLPALLEQEMREQFKTKEAAKNAKFMGKFNQTVPEETLAGAQRDAPEVARGGGQGKSSQQAKAFKQQPMRPPPMKLSDLSTGYRLPKPMPPQVQDDVMRGERGPPSPYRPLGRDDPNMKRGRDNLLNTVESEYYSFFSRFEEPIVRNWYFNLRANNAKLNQELAQRGYQAGAELPCTIRFIIDRSGRFLSIDVVQSSGIPILDMSTRAAVAKLGSLQNPPAGLFEGGDTFEYHLRFMVQVGSGGPGVNHQGLDWY